MDRILPETRATLSRLDEIGLREIDPVDQHAPDPGSAKQDELEDRRLAGARRPTMATRSPSTLNEGGEGRGLFIRRRSSLSRATRPCGGEGKACGACAARRPRPVYEECRRAAQPRRHAASRSTRPSTTARAPSPHQPRPGAGRQRQADIRAAITSCAPIHKTTTTLARTRKMATAVRKARAFVEVASGRESILDRRAEAPMVMRSAPWA